MVQKLVDHSREEYSYDLSKPEKYVIIGDQLTTDIMFGIRQVKPLSKSG